MYRVKRVPSKTYIKFFPNYNSTSVTSSHYFDFINLCIMRTILIVMKCRGFAKLCSLTNPFNSASEPSKLKTAYRFFKLFPSSLAAGSTIARYGPSTSKNIEFSLRRE